MIVVCGLAVTALKGTRLRQVERIELRRAGAHGDRRFFVIDEHDRMLNAKQLGDLTRVIASYDDGQDRLTLTFPEGGTVSERVRLGELLTTRFFSRHAQARLVEGPWSAALSEFVGRPLRLVQGECAVDRGARGAATLISRASLSRLAAEAGEPELDSRRFRMLVEIDGIAAHEEDGWVGRTFQVGDATVRFKGHVGRCLITSRDPETGQIDLPTLDLLGAYRRELETTEPLPFGVYGEVLREGAVRVGDAVLPADSLREA